MTDTILDVLLDKEKSVNDKIKEIGHMIDFTDMTPESRNTYLDLLEKYSSYNSSISYLPEPDRNKMLVEDIIDFLQRPLEKEEDKLKRIEETHNELKAAIDSLKLEDIIVNIPKSDSRNTNENTNNTEQISKTKTEKKKSNSNISQNKIDFLKDACDKINICTATDTIDFLEFYKREIQYKHSHYADNIETIDKVCTLLKFFYLLFSREKYTYNIMSDISKSLQKIPLTPLTFSDDEFIKESYNRKEVNKRNKRVYRKYNYDIRDYEFFCEDALLLKIAAIGCDGIKSDDFYIYDREKDIFTKSSGTQKIKENDMFTDQKFIVPCTGFFVDTCYTENVVLKERIPYEFYKYFELIETPVDPKTDSYLRIHKMNSIK